MCKYRTFNCFLALLLIITSCNDKPLDAESIVAKAYEAHGGKQTWDEVSLLTYQKESKVYDQEGNFRVNTLQEHQYVMLPEFTGSISWHAQEVDHEIRFGEGSAQKYEGGQQVDDDRISASSMETVWTALYTVSQPFKLSDPGVMIYYEGIEALEEGQEVHTIRAEYNKDNDNHTKSDTWWYYFDTENFLCVATLVHHGETFSYIKNLEFDRSTGIVFNHHRKGYAVDKDRNILFHQSEYFYRNFQID